ncbi:MAG: transposase [Candidatus Limnocylindrales bacterium]
MGRRGYPAEFRRKALDLVTAGRHVTDLARDLRISAQTIYVWRRQEQIDRALRIAAEWLRPRLGFSSLPGREARGWRGG